MHHHLSHRGAAGKWPLLIPYPTPPPTSRGCRGKYRWPAPGRPRDLLRDSHGHVAGFVAGMPRDCHGILLRECRGICRGNVPERSRKLSRECRGASRDCRGTTYITRTHIRAVLPPTRSRDRARAHYRTAPEPHTPWHARAPTTRPTQRPAHPISSISSLS